MAVVRRLTPTLWSLLLAVLMLGGALGPGYVLSYDMVWVPDLVLTPDVWGVGTALPRAVPSDAVVAVLDTVVPGMVLQKMVLVGALVAAGAGGAALLRSRALAAQLFAASLMVWNPFVVERLVIGHWPVLVGYAVLPWLLISARTWASSGRLPARLPVLLLVGSLSASTGVATAIALGAAGWRRKAGRHNAVVVLLGLLANLPWLVAGLLHVADATSATAGARVFATGDEGFLPGPLAALSLGGIWNAEVVPATRTGVLGLAWLVIVGALAVLGWVAHRRTPVEGWGALVACWCVGLGLAVVSWAAPGAIGWVAANVPGGGLLRDGSRLLALAAPLTVVLAARGVESLAARSPDLPTRRLVAGVLAFVPIVLLPDAALGAAGNLDAVAYPDQLQDVRAAVQAAPEGDVVLLPFTSYRAPEWNDGRKVLDPLPRFLGRPSVVNDELYVDGRPIAGEDPRARQVAAALALGSAPERAAALAALGVSVVVTEEIPGQDVPEVAGETTFAGDGIAVSEVAGDVHSAPVRTGWILAMGAAWTGWLVLLVAAAGTRLRRGRARAR